MCTACMKVLQQTVHFQGNGYLRLTTFPGSFLQNMNKTTLRNLHKLCLFTCSLQNVITTFFVRHECGQVQGLGRPKLSTRKRIVYQFCSKIYDYMNKWALQTFREWQDQKRSRFAPFSQADCSKVKTWGGCSRVD